MTNSVVSTGRRLAMKPSNCTHKARFEVTGTGIMTSTVSKFSVYSKSDSNVKVVEENGRPSTGRSERVKLTIKSK